MSKENKTLDKQPSGNDFIADVSISASSVDCPECKKKGCGFCKETGLIWFYPSPDAYDHIEISRAKWRISQRHFEILNQKRKKGRGKLYRVPK